MEIEAKILLKERELSHILELVGEPRFYSQNNIIYSSKKGFLRIRTERGWTRATFKGKRSLDEELNCREELDFDFKESEISQMKKMMKLLGFSGPFEYSKRRANYVLNECTVSIDILPNSQKYIEIEGDKENIYKNIKFLGLKKRNIENRSYQQILKDWKGGKDGMHRKNI